MPVLTQTIDPAGLTAAMQARGISRRDLARRAGISESVVVRALKGSTVTERSFARLVAALDETPLLRSDLVEQLGGRRAG